MELVVAVMVTVYNSRVYRYHPVQVQGHLPTIMVGQLQATTTVITAAAIAVMAAQLATVVAALIRAEQFISECGKRNECRANC